MKLPSTENILEIAVHSFQSALAAEQGGADRIELCTALQTGGLTPDPGLLNLVLESISLPVHVLIRPRLGDFIYDPFEFKTILWSIKGCRDLGVKGVVVGCLSEDGSVNQRQLALIKEAAGELDLTFHRAIDVSSNIFQALDTLQSMGYDRVLTSGGAVSAWQGRWVIRKMVEHVKGEKPCIMPGAGVNAKNIAQILNDTGCWEIHGSAKIELPLVGQDPVGITFINERPILTRWESQESEIKLMKYAIS